MKLLVISNNPDRASFRQRIGIYLDILRTNGINCTVAKLPSGYLARQKLFRQAVGFDGVFLQKKCLNFFDAFWLRKHSRKIIYDFDDAVMYDPDAPEHNSYEHFSPFRRTVKLADLVVAGNLYLAEHAKKFSPRVEVLPTGLDVKTYKVENKPASDGKIRLVWIGSKSTLRYLAEIKPTLEEISSRFDNVVLRIISDEFLDLQNIPVEKHPWSLETQITDLVTSDIGLAPLPDNRFTRGKCAFKILQYAAAGLPVVASLVGVNSMFVRDGVTGFVVTDLYEWSDRIAKLITDSGLRQTMGRVNQSMVQSYDVSVLGKCFVNMIMRILKQ